MLNKKVIMLAILLSLLAVSSVSANEIANETSNSINIENINSVIDVDDESNLEIDECGVYEYNDNCSENLNENDILCSEDMNILNASYGSFNDLSNLIKNVDDYGTLTLTKNYKRISQSDYINIDKPIILNGNGYTLDNNRISGDYISIVKNCTLKNLNFIHGEDSFVSFVNVQIIGCNFKDNHLSDEYDGYLFKFWGDNIISNSIFENNIEEYSCGLIRDEGNSLTILNSIFRYNNNAVRGWRSQELPSSLICSAYANQVIIRNCTFNDNNIVGDWSIASGSIICLYNGATIDNCKFIDNTAYGGAIFAYLRSDNPYGHYEKEINVNNCLFESNLAENNGGAINLICYGVDDEDRGPEFVYMIMNVLNCSFIENQASNGGAIHALSNPCGNFEINIENSLFENNTSKFGGAFYLDGATSNAYLKECLFKDNLANFGGAIYGKQLSNMRILNSNFLDNFAPQDGGAIYWNCSDGFITDSSFYNNSASKNGGAIYLNANGWGIYGSIFFNNTANKDSGIYCTGQGGEIKDSYLSNNLSKPAIFSEKYLVSANYNWWGNTAENYNQKPILSNKIDVSNWLFLNFTVDKTTLQFNESATVKCGFSYSNKYGDIINYSSYDLANIVFTVKMDNEPLKYVVLKGGIAEIIYVAKHAPTGVLIIKYNDIEKTFNFNIIKVKTQINAPSIIAIYNKNEYLVATLKDSNGNALSGLEVFVDLNGVKKLTTDKNGQVKVAVGSLVPKTYTAKISFDGNGNYKASSTTAKVTVKKANPKLAAKAKTFKKSVKTKKYAVTLKTNQNKVMKNVKLTLKVNKKTYSATTNAKGQATFKITKLTKKGKFTAVVKFAGNKYYNKVTKKANIKCK